MSKYTHLYDNIRGCMPHPLTSDKDGFLCTAYMYDVKVLLMGYRYGIFPWDNVLNVGTYYYPTQRYLIEPQKIKIPKSMRSFFNQRKFEISVDTHFREVIYSCRHVKRKEDTTWITDQFEVMYHQLHENGYAHSFEVWQDDGLVGGLYGVAVGKVFTGESMFSYVSNASKFAMIYLAKYLEQLGFHYIDCQVINPYLETFGGYEIHKKEFFNLMKKNLFEEDTLGPWETIPLKNITL